MGDHHLGNLRRCDRSDRDDTSRENASDRGRRSPTVFFPIRGCFNPGTSLPIAWARVCASIVAAFGLLYRLPGVGFTIAGIVLFIPLTLGVLMTLLVAGLVAGWPLIVAAVVGGAEMRSTPGAEPSAT